MNRHATAWPGNAECERAVLFFGPRRQYNLGRPAPRPAHRTDMFVTAGTDFAIVGQTPGFLHAARPKEVRCTFLDVSHTHVISRTCVVSLRSSWNTMSLPTCSQNILAVVMQPNPSPHPVAHSSRQSCLEICAVAINKQPTPPHAQRLSPRAGRHHTRASVRRGRGSRCLHQAGRALW